MSLQTADLNREYEKNKKLRKEDVIALRQWCEKQPHLPDISEFHLVLFLQSCYFSIEKAKAAIDVFYTVRTHCPDLFWRRDPSSPTAKLSMDVCLFAPLPNVTPDGYRTMFVKILDRDWTKYDCIDSLRGFDMVMMSWLKQEGTAEGLAMVVDMERVTLGHTTKANLTALKQYLYYVQEGMPIRLCAIHFINVVPFMDTVMMILKPFMKKELLDVIHFHTESIESVYKYVPKRCLPKDFGGEADSVSDLHESMKKQLVENADYFKEEEKYVVDESKRPEKPKGAGDIFGVEGSFKKLDID